MDIKIGEKIKELREHHAMLQKTLAEALNLSQQTVSLYESDSRQPSYKTLVDIANLFQVTTDFLLRDNNDIMDKNNINEIKIERLKKQIGKIIKEKNEESIKDINKLMDTIKF